MFDVNLASPGCVRHYSIVFAGDAGWEAKFEENSTVRWRATYEDWHRVERTLARLRREVADLLARGWTIQQVLSR
jgi:hypothetical protein